MSAEGSLAALLHALPEPVVILTPDLLVRHSNAAFLSATGVTEMELLDRHLIDEVFPDKPGKAEPGRRKLRESFRRVRHTADADVAGVSRYDMPTCDGKVVARYWSPVNSAVLDDRGALSFIVHRVQDVTAARTLRTVLASSTVPGAPAESDGPAGELAGNAEELLPISELTDQYDDQLALLRRVVDARAIIEQAKGMLMAEHRVSAECAFDLLRTKSQNINVKLRDVAAHHVLLHSGQFSIRGTAQRHLR
jgi:hypothetical protein